MNEQRLMRARHDRMIAGVCGGLGKYFEVDPTIVRLVMVLLFFAGGVGFVLYGALWLIMPVEGPGAPVPPQQLGRDQMWTPPPQYDPRWQAPATPVQAQPNQTPSGRFRYDPYTGEPLQPEVAEPAATGTTVRLEGEAPNPANAASSWAQPVTPPPAYMAPPAARNRKPVMGVILLVVGMLAFADQIGINDVIFPLVLIAFGFVLLMRQRGK